MMVMHKRRKWARETDRKLRRRPRHIPEQIPGVDYHADVVEPAGDEEVEQHRRVKWDENELRAEKCYQQIFARFLRDGRFIKGIWMRPCAGEDHWTMRDVEFFATPVGLAQETISARQYAAEWALLYLKAMMWARNQIEIPEPQEVSDDDHEFVKQITGNMPSEMVARCIEAIIRREESIESSAGKHHAKLRAIP